MDNATIVNTVELATVVKSINELLQNILDTFTTKTTRNSDVTNTGYNAQNNVYDTGHYPAPGYDVNHYNEEYSYRSNRRVRNDLLTDMIFLKNAEKLGLIDNANLAKINDVMQNANRSDDNSSTTDKTSDERLGKNEANIDAVKEKIMAEMEKLNSFINNLNLQAVKQ